MQRSSSRSGITVATAAVSPPSSDPPSHEPGAEALSPGSHKRVTWRKLLRGYALRAVLAMQSLLRSRLGLLLAALLALLLAGAALLTLLGAWGSVGLAAQVNIRWVTCNRCCGDS